MADLIERIVPRGDAVETDNAAALPTDEQRGRRPVTTPKVRVRAADLEPYIGLKYLSRLFKLMAIVLILLLVSEIITGLVDERSRRPPDAVGRGEPSGSVRRAAVGQR